MSKRFVFRNWIVAVLSGAALVMTSSVRGDTPQISSVQIQKDGASTAFVISKRGAPEVKDFVLQDPPRLVVDFVGAHNAIERMRLDGDGQFVERVRTSQLTTDPNPVARVVFDLTGEVSYSLSSADDALTVRFFVKDATMLGANASPAPAAAAPAVTQSGGTAGPPASSPESKPTSTSTSAPPASTSAPRAAPTTTASAGTSTSTPATTSPAAATDSASGSPMWTAPPSESRSSAAPPTWSESAPKQPASSDAGWLTPSSSGWTTNRPDANTTNYGSYAASAGGGSNESMTIDVQNADIKSVLRSLSEFSGVNIISGPDVEGKVSAHLKDVPWRHAMDVILKANSYGWREEYGVIRVSTLDRLNKEELEVQAAERKKDDLLPLHTRIIPLSFANAEELKTAFREMLTQRGTIEIDRGTNSLIVRDIEKSIEKIASMAAELDRKTKQVEIVAKMVDVDFEASREIGVRWDAIDLEFGEADVDAVIDAQGGAPAGYLRVGTVQSWGQVQAQIDALERENKANIISNPRIVTADNREANILVGKEIPLIVSDEAGNPITELTKVGIILRVTPHVNSDNSITLDLHPEVSELSSQATVQGGVVISLAEADTRVVVNNGETAVIAGLISEVESSLHSGIPILMDIPVLGALFRLTSDTSRKRELITFVTPRMIESFSQNQE